MWKKLCGINPSLSFLSIPHISIEQWITGYWRQFFISLVNSQKFYVCNKKDMEVDRRMLDFLYWLKDTSDMFFVWYKFCKTDKFCSVSSIFPRDICRCEMLNLSHCVPRTHELSFHCLLTSHWNACKGCYSQHTALFHCATNCKCAACFTKAATYRAAANPGGAEWAGLYLGQRQLPATSRLPALEASLHNMIHCCFFTAPSSPSGSQVTYFFKMPFCCVHLP